MPAAEQFEVRSEQAWKKLLGRKVSIRFALRGNPTHPFSEAIGVVLSVEQDDQGSARARILTRTGAVVPVRVEDVLAGKVWL